MKRFLPDKRLESLEVVEYFPGFNILLRLHNVKWRRRIGEEVFTEEAVFRVRMLVLKVNDDL